MTQAASSRVSWQVMLPVGEVNDRRDTTVALRVGGKPGAAGSTAGRPDPGGSEAGWSDAGRPDDDALPEGRLPSAPRPPDVPAESFPAQPATRSTTAATTSPVRPTSARYGEVPLPELAGPRCS